MLILFVCSGNTCRSPLAEALLRQQLARDPLLSHHQVASAGTGADVGASASDGSMQMAIEHGLDLTAHRARQLTSALVAEAGLILTMTPAHLSAVAEYGGAAKSDTLIHFAGGASGASVSDPFGGSMAGYRVMAAEVGNAVAGVVARLPRAASQ